MKKWIGLFTMLFITVGLLVACGPDDQASSENVDENDNGEMPEKPEKLKLWVNAEDKQEQAVEEITDKYTEETGIEVELTPVDMLDQIEKIDVEGPAGNGPHIRFQPQDLIGEQVSSGLTDTDKSTSKDAEP